MELQSSERGSIKFMSSSFWSGDLTVELFTPVTLPEAKEFMALINEVEERHSRMLTTREVGRIAELFLGKG